MKWEPSSATSNERIGEFNSLAEMIGNKGKGKVWLIVTSQQDLEKVVDRTNFQPALVGRLNARFELKPHLISDEINKVVSERILKKHPAEEPALLSLYQAHEGPIAQLADIKASRRLGTVNERTFVDCYPFLPHQIRLAQDIFEALSGFRISGGVRSMISVVMEALQDLADEEIGVVVSFDQIFDAVGNDLLSQEYLGASGVQAIRESGERVPGVPIDPARVLKVLWLLQRITWVPRVPETLAKLLVRRLDDQIAPLREKVEATLKELQEAGYVARDEATGEWKFLSERERTIEQAIQEMIRPGGATSFSIAAVRRTSQQMAKESVVIKKKLGNFAVPYGKTERSRSTSAFTSTEKQSSPDRRSRSHSRARSHPVASRRSRRSASSIKRVVPRDVRCVGFLWCRTNSKLDSNVTRRSSRSPVTSGLQEDASSDTPGRPLRETQGARRASRSAGRRDRAGIFGRDHILWWTGDRSGQRCGSEGTDQQRITEHHPEHLSPLPPCRSKASISPRTSRRCSTRPLQSCTPWHRSWIYSTRKVACSASRTSCPWCWR